MILTEVAVRIIPRKTFWASGVVYQQLGIVKIDAHQESSNQGDEDAGKRDDERGFAAVLELIDICLHARGEHQDDDAQVGSGFQKICFLDDTENSGTQQQASDQGTDHLRHAEPLGKKT